MPYRDRFITSRASIDFMENFDYQERQIKESEPENTFETNEDNLQNKLYDVLMKSQIFGLSQALDNSTPQKLSDRNGYLGEPLDANLFFNKNSIMQNQIFRSRFSLSPAAGLDASEIFNPLYGNRIIPKLPYKVLDAPELQDDYYLDLINWSRENVLAVGLGKSLYLWIASNSKVIKLHEFPENDSVASVAWAPEGNLLAFGSNRGIVQIWDYVADKELLKEKIHHGRIGSISWSPHSLILSTASRDKTIAHRDIRAGIHKENIISRSIGHKQEVCGVRWSPDGQYVSSGGNDNKVFIWSKGKLTNPCVKFNEHKAAVKAIAWSPHQNGLLATGGGTTDRFIRLLDVTTGHQKDAIDTGSQVCNMVWSVNNNEIVSTHGYSANHVVVWSVNPLKRITQLTGHQARVLYLAMSPDGKSIVTGSGDETLRFWQVFPPCKYQGKHDEEWDVYPSQVNIR